MVLIYAIVAPPLAGFTYIGLMLLVVVLVEPFSLPSGWLGLAVGVAGFLAITPFAGYACGLLQALLVGAVVGIGKLFIRSFGWAHVLILGAAVGLFLAWKPTFLFFTSNLVRAANGWPPVEIPAFFPGSLLLIPVGILPTIAGWFVVELHRRSRVTGLVE